MEQAQVAFTTMLGSARKARGFLGELRDFAARTPFDFPGLVQASQKLLAFGFSSKDVIPTLTAIGDAAAGLGGSAEQVNQITTAIGQIQAKGKVQSDELLQLTEAGIPALKILANSFGISTGKMQEMVTKGLVPANKAIPKLLSGIEHGTKGAAGQTTQFAGLMEKQSHTLTGVWSNLKDAATTSLGNIVGAFAPLIERALPKITEWSQKAGTALAKMARQLVRGLSGKDVASAAGRIGAGIRGIATGARQAWPKIKETLGRIGELIADLFDRFRAAGGAKQAAGALSSITAAATAAGPALHKASGQGGILSDAMDILGGAVDLVARNMDKIVPILGVLAAGFALVKIAQLTGNVAATTGNALRVVQVASTLLLVRANRQLAASTTQAAIAERAKATASEIGLRASIAERTAAARTGAVLIAQRARIIAVSVAQRAAALASKVWAATQWLLNVALSANPIGIVIVAIAALVAGIVIAYKKSETFRKIVSAALNAVKGAALAVVHWFTGHFVPFFTRTIPNAFGAVIDWVSGHWPLLLGLLTGPIGLAVVLIIRHWDRIRSAIVGGIDAVVGFVRSLPGRIVDALGDLGSLLYRAGQNVVQGLIDGITARFGALISAARSIAATIRNFLPFSPAKTGPLSGPGSPQIAGGRIAEMVAAGMIGRRAAVFRAAAALAAAAGVRGPGGALAGSTRTIRPARSPIARGDPLDRLAAALERGGMGRSAQVVVNGVRDDPVAVGRQVAGALTRLDLLYGTG